MQLVLDRVTLATGVTLPYVEQGDPTGVPVILLHGITDSWHSFEPVLPHLPPSIHAFALTQRGHGDAERPATGYHSRDFAADVAAFMDARELDEAIIVGHSMGSIVVQHFAAAQPARARGLVLMGSFFSLRENPAVIEFWEQVVAPLTDPIDPAIAREFQESTLAEPIGPDFLEKVIQESLKVPARVWRAAFAGLLAEDSMAAPSQITAPTLILSGDQDLFAPRSDQNALAAAIADCQLVVYAGAGHALHWEQPARCAADLVRFVEQVGG